MSACWPLQGMSAAQKAVLISLADQANDDGYCWPSVKTISTRTCLSERAVQGAIKWLVGSGIVRSNERSGSSTVYQLTPAAYAPPQEMHPAAYAPPQQMRPAADAPTPAADAGAPPQQLHPTPAAAAPKPSTNHQLNRKEPNTKRVAAPGFVVPDWINRAHWDAWHSCPKRKKATDEQKQMAVDKLDAWRREGVDHAAALENAAIAGWQGLFKPEQSSARPLTRPLGLAVSNKNAGAAASIFDGVWE